MSRTLTAALLSELGNAVTTPGYLVEIQFSTPVRLSTRGTLPWNGNTWISRAVEVGGLGYAVDSPAQSGSLKIGDSDMAMTALVLAQGIASRTINVWKFYGSTPAAADPVQIFAGAGDAAQMDPGSGVVTISLVQRGARELYAPRRFMTKANGFNYMPVPGMKIEFNGEGFTLAASRG